MGAAWAAWCVPMRRSLWLLILGACCALAFAAADRASLGAGGGLLLGFGIAYLNALRGRQGAVSVIVTAWFLVVLIIGVTLFALFGVDPVSAKISSFFSDLGPNAVIGQGFGVTGQSVASSLGAGLGIVGVLLAGLIAFATLFQALLGPSQKGAGVEGSIAIWFAAVGAILTNPADIGMFGPICILLAATSFSISLSCLQAPRARQSLGSIDAAPYQFLKPSVQQRYQTPQGKSRLPSAGQNEGVPSPALNVIGLRQKL
jgi:hypothetical protein